MMGIRGFELVIWVSSVLCILCVSLGFDPTDNYLIDCGSYDDTPVGDRVFVSESSSSNLTKISNPKEILVNTSSGSSLPPYDRALYQTARILDGPSNYTFQIKKQGQHRIRLYFFPFVQGSYNLSLAKFSVSAQNITLLRDYQQPNGSVVKEFSLDITSSSLVLALVPSSKSFAFINALEVISLPDGLIPTAANLIGDPSNSQSLKKQALETVTRVNMGNQTVRPENDTLWRHWDADGPYLVANSNPIFESNITAVNFTRSWPTDIAPSIVYGTVTRLDWESDMRMKANITWFFQVDPGFSYLVRFHLCDIVSVTPQMLGFNIYIDYRLAYEILDFGNLTSDIMGAPYYTDVIAKVSESGTLIVSVGPSSTSNDPNGILNGLEIMKISNSKGSLASSDGEFQSKSTSSKVKTSLIVCFAAGLCTAILALVVFIYLLCRRQRRRKLAHVGQAEDQYNTAIFSSSKIGYRFPFVAIQEATDSFSESLLIGVGGFGRVYKGVLRDGTKVAVKRGSPQSHQGLTEFRTEIEMLSQFRHRHLVSLIGYCDQHDEMIIIYEYMEKGTLKDHLYGLDNPKLSWKQRLEICIGSARGLHYLHTGSATPIIHRDVKSANILLDGNFMAKVADFGLSKTGPEIDQTHVSTAVKGSFGYLDPEYLIRQQLTEKSDVYSFGVVMFEIVCGRPVIDPSLPREQINLVEWAMKWQKRGQLEEIMDPHIAGEAKQESIWKFGEMAEKCLAEHGVERPTMGDVLWNLEYVYQLQCSEEAAADNGEMSHAGGSLAAGFSLASVDDDIVGESMSKVFAQMVREETV